VKSRTKTSQAKIAPRKHARAIPLPPDLSPISPDSFYRKHEAARRKLWGWGLTILDLKIEEGVVPKPIKLDDNGRAVGWYGRTILAWQRDREEKAVAKTATRTS
jgi:predicted DNA-binding transcriptional regulator AlpA